MAPSQPAIAAATLDGPLILAAAGDVMGGSHTLRDTATGSVEILSSLSRSSGRQKTPGQQIAGAYLKTLLAMVELDEAMQLAGVPFAPQPVPTRMPLTLA